MKQIIKSLIVIASIASMAFASVAFAGSTNESASWDTVLVTNQGLSNSTWGSSTSIEDGDSLHVQLHYYLASGDSATNMRFVLEDLAGETFEAGSTEIISGSVKADNLSTSNGSATVNFNDKVRLDLYNVSWQKGGCSSVGCESSLVDSAGKVLTSNGMSIGNVEGYTGSNWQGRHYNGNVIVTFKVTKVSGGSNPTYDDCTLDGVTVEHGDSYRFYSRETVSYGEVCSAYDQVRTCNDGDFSGSDSFKYAICSINGPTSGDDVEVQTNAATSIDEDSARLNGEVEEGNNVKVWFAIAEDSTPSCSSSSDRLSLSGSYDEGDDFSRTATGLDEDETYYFRACAEDEDGDIVSGNVRSFETDDNGSSSNNGDDPFVETDGVDNVTEDAATLNASFELNEADDIDVWFQYGDDRDLDDFDSTDREEFSRDDTHDVRVRNLEDDEKYYYRAVIRDGSDVYYGDIRSFTTDEADDDADVEATTNRAGEISDDEAELRGYVDLDDASEARVFFEYGLSAGLLNRDTDSITVDEDSEIETDIEGLQSCTTYFYRLVARDLDSNRIDRGETRSFRTNGDNCDGGNVINPVASEDLSAVTRLASSVRSRSATLNSYVFGSGSGATCYFQYGRTQSFGLTSVIKPISLDVTNACSASRTGLVPNTTYYYRAVVTQNGATEYGLTRTFRTASAPVVTTVRPNPVTNVVVSAPAEDPLEVTKWVSTFDDPRFDEDTVADRDEAVFYKVRVTNNSNETIEDITVIDRIPFYLELDGQESLDDDAEKEVRWSVARLQPGDSREFTTEMRVRDDARYGSVIESYATARTDEYNVNSNDVFIEVERDEPVDVVEEENPSQAASIFGTGFFPTTLIGWLVLLGIVFVIAYLVSRIFFARNENARVLAELRAMQSGANNNNG